MPAERRFDYAAIPEEERVIEERRRYALEVARQQSEAMRVGYTHLFGHEEEDDEEQTRD